MKSVLVCSSVVLTALVCGGCAVESDGTIEQEDVAVMEEAIGEAGCATATPDATTGDPPFAESPLTYSNSTCFKAYVVRVNNWTHSNNKVMRVSWNSSIPTDQLSCTSAWMRADLYQLVGSSWQFVKKDSVTGVWNSFSGTCSIQNVLLSAASGTYKLAMAGRKSSASSALTRRVKLDRTIIIE